MIGKKWLIDGKLGALLKLLFSGSVKGFETTKCLVSVKSFLPLVSSIVSHDHCCSHKSPSKAEVLWKNFKPI